MSRFWALVIVTVLAVGNALVGLAANNDHSWVNFTAALVLLCVACWIVLEDRKA